jgi:hypothetical protein
MRLVTCPGRALRETSLPARFPPKLTDAPRTSQASTTRALNLALCRRLVRFAGALLSVRSFVMVSTFFMVDTIGQTTYSITVGSPDAYDKPGY